uniref:Cytochrome b5-like heme/steroid binding domain protein n=1 Tax=Marseillevirus LCMAC102 TaxID=2506603 RepID=A0A481YSS5_9VIRU|nr:MAG: cytochrome b5-like heme/steroid binding domain protein [Marseillevirus LCMAC102]
MNYTFAEVAQHNTENDIWVVIDDKVYEVTKFLVDHPEARNSLVHYAGKDATIPFTKTTKHLQNGIEKLMLSMCVGTLK